MDERINRLIAYSYDSDFPPVTLNSWWFWFSYYDEK